MTRGFTLMSGYLQLFEAAQQHLKMLYISELFLKVIRVNDFQCQSFLYYDERFQ